MNNKHPITPPLKLERQWSTKYIETSMPFTDLVAEVARWGADQELEACIVWMSTQNKIWLSEWAENLCAARRPKPPSLKEQALKALHTSVDLDEFPKQYDTIRHALEALPND